jgi:MoaA/NifB/PqqE/SkfB family radical SAM enzyme
MMINIFVTYRCNLACPYCFARELIDEYPQDMDAERFGKLLGWMRQAALPAAAFIGGEPTLHPGLADMIARTADAGVAPVLFTNGLFRPGLADRLAPLVSNFVVNYNDPSLYTPAQRDTLRATLSQLRDLGARITFSKNFSSQCTAFEYLLAGCEEYGVASVRYDISRPSVSATNDHFTDDDTRRMISHIVGFVKACENRGIRTGLDCSVRLCDLKVEDRSYLERVSMKFTGVCHPSIDVHPDLSASYCLPMRDISVPDVTRFSNQDALMWHFAEKVRPVRQANVSKDCFDCRDFMRRCQGGCMALRRAARMPGETACCATQAPEGE